MATITPAKSLTKPPAIPPSKQPVEQLIRALEKMERQQHLTNHRLEELTGRLDRLYGKLRDLWILAILWSLPLLLGLIAIGIGVLFGPIIAD
jgi:hypothetical protein